MTWSSSGHPDVRWCIKLLHVDCRVPTTHRIDTSISHSRRAPQTRLWLPAPAAHCIRPPLRPFTRRAGSFSAVDRPPVDNAVAGESIKSILCSSVRPSVQLVDVVVVVVKHCKLSSPGSVSLQWPLPSLQYDTKDTPLLK